MRAPAILRAAAGYVLLVCIGYAALTLLSLGLDATAHPSTDDAQVVWADALVGGLWSVGVVFIVFCVTMALRAFAPSPTAAERRVAMWCAAPFLLLLTFPILALVAFFALA